MPNKIRLGFIGANVRSHWASQSHFPALKASPDVEMTAVCTTRSETAEAAKQAFNAKLAFTDFREMIASKEIDAVAVVVRVPLHYEPTKAAIEAGKHVYTEWPLGRTTAEAEELAALAREKGVQTAVGLQSRVSSALLYMKDLIAEGYVGEVLACHADCMRDGPLERPSSRSWQRDANLGANPLTIANGHVIDALRFVVGDFARVSCMVTTQAKQWYETDTKKMVDVTSPDNILVSGKLERGAVASVHVAAVPWAGGGVRMVIYGREGTLVATGDVSSQRGQMLRVQGAQRSHELADLPIPERYTWVPPEFPRGDPFNVGQMYALFAQAIRGRADRAATGSGGMPRELPTFDTAVGLHRFLDTIRQSSDTGRELEVRS
jgi:predicted dehydrogenase